MYFTIEDYRKIEQWLRRNSVKDTEFLEVSDLSLNETLPIIQDSENKKISLKNLISYLQLQKVQIDSELDIHSTNPVENQAITNTFTRFSTSIEELENSIARFSTYIEELRNRKLIETVEELPSIETAKDSVVYVLLEKVGKNNNLFTEWIKVNNTWEKIGELETDIDLSSYLKIQDAPFKRGFAKNSAVLKGENNQVISEGGVASGKNNFIGLKGWYYGSIYKHSNDTIYVYLSKTQKILPLTDESFKTSEQVPDSSLPNLYNILGHNTIVSLVNDEKYDNYFRVIGGGNGYVVLVSNTGEIPFTSIKHELLNDPEDYSIYCLSNPGDGMFDMGQASFASGYNNKATNGKSTAFGYNNHAYGKFSFVEGRDNKAAYCSHAEGRGTKADGEESHAEGRNTTASGKHSHAEGDITEAMGINAHAEGYLSKASGNSSHAEGGNWVKGAAGDNRVSGGTAEGAGSHAEGARTTAIANYSHAEGYRSIAGGPNSHTEGQLTRTGGEDADRPTGNPGTKSGQNAHAEGAVTFAQGAGSHAEGGNTWASGNYSHTEGWQTRTHPNANNSHAEGFYTEVYNRAEHASGQYNVSIKSSDKSKATQFSIGIGTSATDRKNAIEVKQNGDVYILGIGNYDGTSHINARSLQQVIWELQGYEG